MSQFEEIPSPGRGFQGSRALGGLAACKTLASQISETLVSYPHTRPQSTASTRSLQAEAHIPSVRLPRKEGQQKRLRQWNQL